MFFSFFFGIGVFIANTVIYIKRKNEENKKLKEDLELEKEVQTVFVDSLSESEEQPKEKYVPVFENEVQPENKDDKSQKTGENINSDIENLRKIFKRNI